MRPPSFRIGCERVRGVDPRKVKENFYFQIRIFIDAYDRLDLHDVRYVIYELHPSFRNPKQISRSIRNDFEIQLWTWGFFDIKAKIVFKEGHVQEIQGYIQYDVKDAKKFALEEKERTEKRKPRRKKKGLREIGEEYAEIGRDKAREIMGDD